MSENDEQNKKLMNEYKNEIDSFFFMDQYEQI
jgi:hypothetical protein